MGISAPHQAYMVNKFEGTNAVAKNNVLNKMAHSNIIKWNILKKLVWDNYAFLQLVMYVYVAMAVMKMLLVIGVWML